MGLTEAYSAVGCDPSTSDEDVVVAYYSRRPPSGSGSSHPVGLTAIAVARKSRFLFFVLSIYQHLNDRNVAILAKKESTLFASPEPDSPDGEFSQPEEASSSEADAEQDEYGEPYGTPEGTSEASSSEPKSPSSSEAEINSSSDDMSVDLDFEDEVGGIFFDKTSWRCEDCYTEIVDGECPNGHDLQCCRVCNWPLVDGSCPSCHETCEECGMGMVDGACSGCATDEDEDFIVSDTADGIWRCIYCQWEVEADNDTDGNCHCLNNKGEARYLDLSDCLDYEPADSDSSHYESTSDEDPDSDDEGFIDDENIAVEGPFDHATSSNGLALLTTAMGNANPIRAMKDMKTMVPAEDKENAEPQASSDVEIVDGPDVGGSNIVDIEAMDM